jgi:cell division protein FtsL
MNFVIVGTLVFSAANLALTTTALLKTKKAVEDAQELVTEERQKLNDNKNKVAALLRDLDL